MYTFLKNNTLSFSNATLVTSLSRFQPPYHYLQEFHLFYKKIQPFHTFIVVKVHNRVLSSNKVLNKGSNGEVNPIIRSTISYRNQKGNCRTLFEVSTAQETVIDASTGVPLAFSQYSGTQNRTRSNEHFRT